MVGVMAKVQLVEGTVRRCFCTQMHVAASRTARTVDDTRLIPEGDDHRQFMAKVQ